MKRIAYRGGYKYQLAEDYIHYIKIYRYSVDLPFLVLRANGMLRIKAGYAWDGPSGPTLDTADAMRGSLVHDAKYQLMREGKLPITYRINADDLLYSICREDGMGVLRAWLWYRAVRLFASPSAARSKAQTLYAPR